MIAATSYGGARFVADRDLARTIAVSVEQAERDLVLARAAARDSTEFAHAAVARVDRGDDAGGDEAWASALAKGDEARAAYLRGARVLEATFLLDTARSDVRRRLADVTYERIMLAERFHRNVERKELEQLHRLRSRPRVTDRDLAIDMQFEAPEQIEPNADALRRGHMRERSPRSPVRRPPPDQDAAGAPI